MVLLLLVQLEDLLVCILIFGVKVSRLLVLIRILLIGLLQGSYYVTTRDALGCEVVDSIYISEPEPLSMEASELDWIDCYNDSTGEAFATATGGTLPYVFDWDNGQWIGDTINTLTQENIQLWLQMQKDVQQVIQSSRMNLQSL